MLIELRKLAISKHLSEETTAYSAEIWINGVKTFAASNHGHGGCDLYRQLGTMTEQQVNTWLKANQKPRLFNGVILEPDLETEIASLMDAAAARQSLTRKLKATVVTIEGEQVYTYPLKNRDRTALTAEILKRSPNATIVTVGDEPTITRALALLAIGDE